VFGGQAGYNWQRGPVVGGLEIDFSSTGIDGVSTPTVILQQTSSLTVTRADDVKWLGSARARLGFTPGGGCCSNFLVYGTGGLAWERFEQTTTNESVSQTVTSTSTTTTPHDRFGWVIGAGAEARLGGTGWIGRIEYLHYEFGTSQTVNVVTSSNPLSNFAEKADNQTINVVRGGLSYKF
jgi:outer membrane immunogenic protein